MKDSKKLIYAERKYSAAWSRKRSKAATSSSLGSACRKGNLWRQLGAVNTARLPCLGDKLQFSKMAKAGCAIAHYNFSMSYFGILWQLTKWMHVWRKRPPRFIFVVTNCRFYLWSTIFILAPSRVKAPLGKSNKHQIWCVSVKHFLKNVSWHKYLLWAKLPRSEQPTQTWPQLKSLILHSTQSTLLVY